MGIREEFYDSLRQEYELEGERSFLYQYFLDRPRRRRGGVGDTDVRRTVQIFLYDVRHGRKKDQSLAMLDAYCAWRGISSLLTGEAETDLEELEAFCNTLKAGKNNTVLIPLKIDPGTGAGLYLMGVYFLKKADLCQDKACCYACLWMEELMLLQDNGQYLWSISGQDRERLEEQCGFPNLTEALCWFQHLTAMDQEAYQAYTVYNGPAPPNCPPALRRYFEPDGAQAGPDVWIAQGRESFEREEKNGES